MRIFKFKIWCLLAAVFVLFGLSGAAELKAALSSESKNAQLISTQEDTDESVPSNIPAEKTATEGKAAIPTHYVAPPSENIADSTGLNESSSIDVKRSPLPPSKNDSANSIAPASSINEDATLPKKAVHSSYVAPATENIAGPADKVPSDAAITMDLALKDQVKQLRAKRERQMPYLNKATIREKINVRKLRSRQEFSSGGSKSLDDLLERAVQVYTPALAARERIVLSKRKILGALRALAPDASFQYGLKKGTLSGDPYTSQNYKVSLTQPIFRGGILWNTLLQEKAGLEAAQKDYVSTIEDLVSEVTTAYLEYNRAYQVVQNQEKTLETLKHYVDISKQKYKAQLISEIENLNVESLYSLNQYDHETSKQELELAKLDLQRYLDIGLDAPVETQSLYNLDNFVSEEKEGDSLKTGDSSNIDQDSPSTKLNELVDLAYQHRAQLQVESSKLDSARLQEKIRLGEFMPKLDLSIDFGKLGEAYKAIRQDAPGLRQEFKLLVEMNWNIGGNKASWSYDNDEKAPTVSQFANAAGTTTRGNSFQIGLLDGLSDWVSVKEAEVAKLDQITQLEKAEKEVIHDVKQSYFDYQKAKIRVKSSIQRYNYRKRLNAYSKHRLGKNEIQVSEYLQSEIDVLTETTTLHKALADYYTAEAKLNHAVGIRNYFPLKEFHADASKP